MVIIVQCENNLGFHNLDVKNRQGASYPIIGCIIGGTIRNSLVLVAGALFTYWQHAGTGFAHATSSMWDAARSPMLSPHQCVSRVPES